VAAGHALIVLHLMGDDALLAVPLLEELLHHPDPGSGGELNLVSTLQVKPRPSRTTAVPPVVLGAPQNKTLQQTGRRVEDSQGRPLRHRCAPRS
jgi:hypothetical protein